MKITILEITEWDRDNRLIDGDASHEGRERVEELIAEEEDAKLYGEWTEGLPFECEAENLYDALEMYNTRYCDCDYLKAVECEADLEDD